VTEWQQKRCRERTRPAFKQNWTTGCVRPRESAAFGALARRCWRGGVEFEVCKHEVDEHLPAVEVEIAGQGLHIVEEGLAGGEFNSHASILFVAEIEHGVKQERQQVEHHEYQRQVLLAVAEVAAGPDGNRSS